MTFIRRPKDVLKASVSAGSLKRTYVEGGTSKANRDNEGGGWEGVKNWKVLFQCPLFSVATK